MQFGISARGLAVSVGGAQRLLDEILRWMPSLATGHDVLSYQESGQPVAPGTTPVWVSAPHPVWWEQFALPRAVRRQPPRVLLAPKTLLPIGLPASVKTVSIVLDLLYFPVRGNYLHEYKWRDIAYNRLFYRSSCRRADRVVCISDHTRRDLLSVCPLPPEKVRVVPLGVSLPPAVLISPERITDVRARHGLHRPYIFYAGSLSPRKNMVRGVQAWAGIADRIPHDLVVTAGKSWRDQAVEDEVDRVGLRARFLRIGAVPDQDMPALYAGADVFFFPSLYEGFGLPVLEAMACGCPVVASRSTSIPEVAGSAALLADPWSVPDLGRALLRVLQEPSVAGDLREAGVRQAAAFPWERTVKALVEIMEETGATP